jgi:hypothetical protein
MAVTWSDGVEGTRFGDDVRPQRGDAIVRKALAWRRRKSWAAEVVSEACGNSMVENIMAKGNMFVADDRRTFLEGFLLKRRERRGDDVEMPGVRGSVRLVASRPERAR